MTIDVDKDNDGIFYSRFSPYPVSVNFWICANCGKTVPAVKSQDYDHRKAPPEGWERYRKSPEVNDPLNLNGRVLFYYLCPTCKHEGDESNRDRSAELVDKKPTGERDTELTLRNGSYHFNCPSCGERYTFCELHVYSNHVSVACRCDKCNYRWRVLCYPDSNSKIEHYLRVE